MRTTLPSSRSTSSGSQPGAVGRAIGLVADHALGEQAVERLVAAGHLHFAHRPRPEARIEQMQDRVLDAADILVDRHPVVVLLAIERRRRELRRGEAVEVPARIRRRCRTCRSRAAPRRRRSGSRRASRSDDGRADCPACRRSTSSGSVTGRSFSGTGTTPHVSQWIAGIGAAPVALARHQPVAQAVLRGALADAHLLAGARSPWPWRPRPSRPSRNSELMITPSSTIGRLGDAENFAASASVGITTGRIGRPYLVANSMVALVVAGAAEDRAGAVFHQHEVGGIDRQGLARHQRMPGQQRQLVALLLGGLDLGRGGAGLAALGDEALQAGIASPPARRRADARPRAP